MYTRLLYTSTHIHVYVPTTFQKNVFSSSVQFTASKLSGAIHIR